MTSTHQYQRAQWIVTSLWQGCHETNDAEDDEQHQNIEVRMLHEKDWELVCLTSHSLHSDVCYQLYHQIENSQKSKYCGLLSAISLILMTFLGWNKTVTHHFLLPYHLVKGSLTSSYASKLLIQFITILLSGLLQQTWSIWISWYHYASIESYLCQINSLSGIVKSSQVCCLFT